jgi:nickel/cobalt transporter (NicO) family protein
MTTSNEQASDRRRSPHLPRGGRRLGAAALGFVAVLILPGLVAAHPLGNFTINHYAGVRVEPDRILLDVVIDQAEIPAFQARMTFDTDGDGEVSDAETETGRLAACQALSPSLDLRVDGVPRALELTEGGLTFPPGAAGLSTMRSVCGFQATLGSPLEAGSEIFFADRSFGERLGWREIMVQGSGVSVVAAAGADTLRTSSPSNRLTNYPTNLLTQALADNEVALLASPGGPLLPPLDIPDAAPLASSGAPAGPNEAPIADIERGPTDFAPATAQGQAEAIAADATTPDASGTGVPDSAAVVPGGVGSGDLPSIFRAANLTPLVLLLSILTAAALGAAHALTPGHGKTLMAAYLVGTRGTPIHAAGLGLSVALSHTLGILALAALVVGAQGVLPPDVVVRSAPVVAALSIVAIGGWMLFAEARRRWRASGSVVEAEHARAHAAGHDHDHDHDTDHDTDHDHSHSHDHGAHHHSHLPRPGSTISWRSLFVLGLAGGLIPSASALLILLGSIAAGRPAFGFVLVVAFGLGMALVMGGIGFALVVARARLDRVGTSTWLGRAGAYLPLVASCLVFGFGLYLTVQAVSGNTTL